MLPAVADQIEKWSSCANPSSTNYDIGSSAHRAMDAARESIGKIMSVSGSEIYFTSGATEANNILIQGFIQRYRRLVGKRPHVITSAFEHKSVLQVVQQFEARGDVSATYIKPNVQGIIDPQVVAAAVGPNTALVSIMHANNELGTVQDIPKIGKLLAVISEKLRPHRSPKAPPLRFHVDCSQTLGKISVRPRCDFHADAVTFSAHKFHGPKGVGGFYLRCGVECDPLTFGGPQETGIRPGTENVSGIRGMALALNLISEDREKRNERLRFLTNKLVDDLRQAGIHVSVVSHSTQRLPHSLMIAFIYPEFQFCNTRLVKFCGDRGVYISVGSACETKSKKSYVMHAINAPPIVRRGAIRIGMSDETTDHDLEILERTLIEGVQDQMKNPSTPSTV